jgi:hypothetical protein
MAELVGQGLNLVRCQIVVIPEAAVVGGTASALQIKGTVSEKK